MSKEYPCVHYDHGKCKKYSMDGVESYCVMGPCQDETPSNADRIRAMSDEELAEYILNHRKFDFERTCLEWLRQPAEEEHHG